MKALLVFISFISLVFTQEEFKPQSSLSGYGELHLNVLQPKNKSTSSSLDFHRFVIFYGYNFTEKWSFKSEVEIEHNFVQDGQGELELEQAFIDYHPDDFFGLRTGVLLMPIGYINETHEPPTFFGVERPDFDKDILPTTWFDNGLMIYGKLNNQFTYQAAVFNGLKGDSITIRKGLRDMRTKGFNKNIDPARKASNNFDRPAFVLRADFIGIEDLNIGASYFFNKATNVSTGLSSSVSLFELHAKYQHDNIQTKVQYAQVNLDKSIAKFEGHNGFLVELAYDLISKEENLFVFARYEDLNKKKGSETEDASHFSIITLGLNFKPISQIVFKADYQISNNKVDKISSSYQETSLINLGMGYMF